MAKGRAGHGGISTMVYPTMLFNAFDRSSSPDHLQQRSRMRRRDLEEHLRGTTWMAQATVGRVLVDLEEVFDSRFVALLRFLLSRPDRRITPIEAAAFYKAHPKTLRGHLRESRLPTTEKLIVWTRLFHAGALLSDRTRSHEEIALALGYDSASLLHRQARAYAGMTLADLELSGMPGLLEEFRRRLQIDDWSLHAPPRD